MTCEIPNDGPCNICFNSVVESLRSCSCLLISEMLYWLLFKTIMNKWAFGRFEVCNSLRENCTQEMR